MFYLWILVQYIYYIVDILQLFLFTSFKSFVLSALFIVLFHACKLDWLEVTIFTALVFCFLCFYMCFIYVSVFNICITLWIFFSCFLLWFIDSTFKRVWLFLFTFCLCFMYVDILFMFPPKNLNLLQKQDAPFSWNRRKYNYN